MNNLDTRILIRKLAKKYNISITEIELMVKSPFLELIDVMKSGDREEIKFDSLYIKHFGTFKVKEGRRRALLEYREKAKNKQLAKNIEDTTNMEGKDGIE